MSKLTKFYTLSGVPPSFSPSTTFFSSWLLTPLQLAILRSLISLYAFVVIFFIFGWYDSHHLSVQSRDSFSYFTDLNYWGLAFYFAFSAAHGFSYVSSGYVRSWLDVWPRPLQVLHCMFYTTIITFPFLTTIVYWAILYDGFASRFDAWQNVSFHALNSVYALLEILLPSTTTPPPLHLTGLIILLLLYLALAYLTHATEGFYTYSFLDIQTKGSGSVTGYCFGILAAICVIFGVVWFLIWGRRRLTIGRSDRADRRSERVRGREKRGKRRSMRDIENGNGNGPVEVVDDRTESRAAMAEK